MATLGLGGALDESRIDNRLLGQNPDRENRALNEWGDARNTAHMMWLVITWERANSRTYKASQHLGWAIDRGHHLLEPRLTLLACDEWVDTGRVDEARRLAISVLSSATTDPAYGELRDWLAHSDAHRERHARATKPRVITHPRLARPDGRSNPNPYLPT